MRRLTKVTYTLLLCLGQTSSRTILNSVRHTRKFHPAKPQLNDYKHARRLKLTYRPPSENTNHRRNHHRRTMSPHPRLSPRLEAPRKTPSPLETNEIREETSSGSRGEESGGTSSWRNLVVGTTRIQEVRWCRGGSTLGSRTF